MKQIFVISLLYLCITSASAQNDKLLWAATLESYKVGYEAATEARSTTTDDNGNVYITGFFHDTVDFDPTSGVALCHSFFYDGYIQKLDAKGNLEWVSQIVGDTNDTAPYGVTPYMISSDSENNIIVVGCFGGTADFDPGNSEYNLTSNGLCDIFILKLNFDGDFIWAKALGGANHDLAYSAAIDKSQNICLTGYYKGVVDFNPATASTDTFFLLNASDYNSKIYILKLDKDGEFLWAKSIGGEQGNVGDIGRSITTDLSENVLITGPYILDSIDFDPSPTSEFYISNKGYTDIFILKLDKNGDFIWAKSIGGKYPDYGNSIVTDNFENVYVNGSYSDSVDFDPGINVYTLTTGNSSIYSAGYILKLSSNGDLKWAQQIGVSSKSNIKNNTLAIDNLANLYTIGWYIDTIDFNPSSAIEDTFYLRSQENGNIFILKLDSSGNFEWANAIGAYRGYSISIDDNYNVFASGNYGYNADLYLGEGAFNFNTIEHEDAYVIKFGHCVLDTSVEVNSTALTANQIDADYQWVNCSSFLALEEDTNQMFLMNGSESYYVIVSKYGCVDTSACITISNTNHGNLPKNVSIYPNPTTGLVKINLGNFTEALIKVSTESGQLVYQETGISGFHKFELTGASGLYIVEVTSQDETQSFKLIKE